jgi:hypothetical protein
MSHDIVQVWLREATSAVHTLPTPESLATLPTSFDNQQANYTRHLRCVDAQWKEGKSGT